MPGNGCRCLISVPVPVPDVRCPMSDVATVARNPAMQRMTSQWNGNAENPAHCSVNRVSNFRKLRVWQEAQRLVIDANRIVSRMKGAASATLRDQALRAAMSVTTNIVEGSAHTSPREFCRYLGYSIASASEFEGHMQLGHDLGMISKEDLDLVLPRVAAVRMMSHGLIRKLKGGG